MGTQFNRKTKGKNFEEKIANLIHNSLIENLPAYKRLDEEIGNKNIRPHRDATSGASNKSEGDIALGMAMNFFPFSLELKDWKSLTDIDINSIFKGKCSSIFKVWSEQCVPNANKASEYHNKKLFPMQIWKGLRTINFTMYREKDLKIYPKRRLHYEDLIICKFEDFLELYLESIKNKFL